MFGSDSPGFPIPVLEAQVVSTKFTWRREGCEGTLEKLINICRVGVRRMGPDFFQRFSFPSTLPW